MKLILKTHDIQILNKDGIWEGWDEGEWSEGVVPVWASPQSLPHWWDEMAHALFQGSWVTGEFPGHALPGKLIYFQFTFFSYMPSVGSLMTSQHKSDLETTLYETTKLYQKDIYSRKV